MKTNRYILSLTILLIINILPSFSDPSKYGKPSDINGDSGGLGGIFFLMIIVIIALVGGWIGKMKNNK